MNFLQRQTRVLIDEMPTGDHRERAAAWRMLAARCRRAAERHDAEADRREASGEGDESLRWAKLERARRFVRAQEWAPRQAAEAIVADAAPAPRPVAVFVQGGEVSDLTAQIDAMHEGWALRGDFGAKVQAEALECRRQQILADWYAKDPNAAEYRAWMRGESPSSPAGFTDAAGYVHLVELAGDPLDGTPPEPEKP